MAGHAPGEAESGGWRRGHLSEARRRTLNAKIAAVAVGGPLGEQLVRMLDATGRITVPARVEVPDAVQVEHAAGLCTAIDLQYGGGVADQLARALLRWAIGLLETGISEQLQPRLYAAIGGLAQRAGWAAFDADSHETARALLTIALYAAGRADDADLAAHVIADLAAQHNFLGYPNDCLRVARFGEVDERVGPAVRMVLNIVKAWAYAARGDEQACRRHIELAEVAHAEATNLEGWLATVATPARLYAGTGHAAATLARRTNSTPARAEAKVRLGKAVELLHPTAQARAAALCLTQLTSLHLEADAPDQALAYGARLIEAAGSIRSARLAEHLTTLRRSAETHSEPAIKQLAVNLAGVPAGAAWRPASATLASRDEGAVPALLPCRE